jgi:ribonuclease HI
VVFECPLARSFRDEVNKLTGTKVPRLHQATWAKDLLTGEHCPAKSAELIICGAWSLWSGRNARKHGNQSWDAAAAARHISSMLEDLIWSGNRVSPASVRVRGCWQKPPSGWTKINTDAAFTKNKGTGTSGAVIGNDQGVVLAAAARVHFNIADVLMAEALATRDGVLLAVEQGMMKVILETDNASVTSLLSSDEGLRSTIAGIWHEVKELSLSFISFTCSHVNREGNEAAHLCARMPSMSSPTLSWIGDLPNWLREAANRDCNVVMQ